MEPRRQDDVIRAGLALHAWRLLTQYEQLTKDLSPANRYESTLTLCVLQSMLTNCWELWKFLNDRKASDLLRPLKAYTLIMLADPRVEVHNSFRGETDDLKAVLSHVRNALSHPRMRETEPPTTGYTTVEDGSGYVSRLRFTDSPDITRKGSRISAQLDPKRGSLENPRIFTIELPLSLVNTWTKEIAVTLAQPFMDNWDNPELVPLAM